MGVGVDVASGPCALAICGAQNATSMKSASSPVAKAMNQMGACGEKLLRNMRFSSSFCAEWLPPINFGRSGFLCLAILDQSREEASLVSSVLQSSAFQNCLVRF